MSSTDSLPPKLTDDDATGLDAPIPSIMYRLTRRRRRVLEILLDARSAMAEPELATRVAARETGTRPSSIDDGTRESVSVELQQVDLPALADVALLEWPGAGGTVSTSDHPVFEEHWFQRLVRTDAELDALVECLASERRLDVLEALGDAPMTRDELAERVAAGEPASSVEDVRISLRHGHLPKLEDAGLIEYLATDGDADHVADGDDNGDADGDADSDADADADGPLVRRTCSTVEEAWLQYLSDS